MNQKHRTEDITDYSRNVFLRYAMSTLRGRAIPAVPDGLKPVQRRILYAMRDLSLDHTAKPKKSARVVGDVIGKYHPHGDSSVYEAMVLMAQPFKMRYPLVHGEGNFGFVDEPKSYAAMRYTEARLTPIADALLDELKWDTVDHAPNYDSTLTEPVLMPARLPFLLLNATPGIAVGMATVFLPHQLNEVVEAAKLMLTQKSVTLDQLMEKMPGPDFATGGRIISSHEEIKKVYAEGRGAIRVRAKWTVERLPRNKWVLHVHELPPDVSPTRLLRDVDELINPAPKKDKKDKAKNGAGKLSPTQARNKKLFGELIDQVKDLSDKGQIDLAFWPKDSSMDPEDFARLLCASTDLELNVSANLVAVDSQGSARDGAILDWLGQWCDFRVITVRRRTEHQRAKNQARLHILEGRLKILADLDTAIRIIRTADNPKAALMERFSLDETQAEDILELRLRQLQRLEQTRLEDEAKGLRAEIARLDRLLADDKLLRKEIVKELDSDAKRFGDVRRSELAPDKGTNNRQLIVEQAAETLGPDPIAVALTERGWIGWRPVKTVEEALAADYKVKAGDAVRRIYFGDRHDQLALMDETGRAYSLRLADLPSKADTLPLSTWFDTTSRFVEGAVASATQRFVVAGTNGRGFVVNASDWFNRMKAGKAFLELQDDPGAVPLPPVPLPDAAGEGSCLVALASDGRAVAFPLADLKSYPKGKGLNLLGLGEGASLADLALAQQTASLVLKTAKGQATVGAAQWNELIAPRSANKKGKLLHKQAPGAVFVRPGREEPSAPAG